MRLIGVNTKRFICFILETVMIAFIFTYSLSLDAPNNDSKASFEATPTQQIVLKNTAGASELPYEAISKVCFATFEEIDFTEVVPAMAVNTSRNFNVNSLRNPLYTYITTNAP
jgi:hypothetical protein